MFDTLKWLNIEQRHEFNNLSLIHKIKDDDGPEYLCNQIKYVGKVQPYQLRNAENFKLEWQCKNLYSIYKGHSYEQY